MKQVRGIRFSQKLLDSFRNYCLERASQDTCKQYYNRLREIAAGRSWEATRWTRTAFKLYARFLCEEKNDSRACDEYKRIKLKQSSEDTYIPSDEEIREALRSELGYYYRLLIESGLRVDEVVKVLNDLPKLAPGDIVYLDGFTRIRVDWRRGNKKAVWAYFLEIPRPILVNNIYKRREKLGLLPMKYTRKWFANNLYRLRCREAVINFIQGRTPDSVLRKHYLQLLHDADECYRKYANWLREWLSDALASGSLVEGFG